MTSRTGDVLQANSKDKQRGYLALKLGSDLRFKLLVLVALPLCLTYLVTSLAGWYIFEQINENIQHITWPSEADKTRALDLVNLARLTLGGTATLVVGLTVLSLPFWFREGQRSLGQMTEATSRLGAGDFETPVPQTSAELSDLAHTLENTRLRLRTTLTETARQAKAEAALHAEGQHNNELSILLALSQLLLTTTSEESIVNLVAETALELLGSDFSAVVLLNEKTNELNTRAVRGWSLPDIGLRFIRMLEPQTRYMLRQGRPLAVDDYRLPLPFSLPKSDFTSTALAGLSVPLRHENRPIGVLFIHSRQTRHFTSEDTRSLSLVANQAAAALERAHLYTQSVTQASELRTLARIGEALNGAETLEATLRLVLTEALKLVNNDQGCIILVEPDLYTLRLYTSLGIPEIVTQRFNERHFQKYHGVFARSILRGEMVELDESTANLDPIFEYADTLLSQKVNVPLKTGDKTIGVIALNGLPVDAPARRMLMALADLATTAITKTRLHERTQMLTITDELTSLYNRRGFVEVGQREFKRARRLNRPLSALMLDIDNFKAVNDTYSPAVGNSVLTELAEMCRREMRDVDLLGRYGGEEFVALLPDTDLNGIYQAADRLRRTVAANTFNPGRAPLQLTISLGIATLADIDDTLAHLLNRADQALNIAKQTGRDRVYAWTVEKTDP